MKNFLNVGNSVSLFFVFLLILSVIIIFSFDKNIVTPYVSPGDIPKIELNNFTIYQINNENLLMKLYAKNAKQFDKFDEFSDVLLERLNNNIIDKITAPIAIRKDNIIFFDQGVNDFRDGYDIYTTKGIYHIDKNIMEGEGSFSIKGNFQNIIGEDIYYDAEHGITKAKNIQAKLSTKKQRSKK